MMQTQRITTGANTMKKETLVLAALAAGGIHRHTPVQAQKLMFMIDREVPEQVDGPHFNFIPYDYGPFDKQVYFELDELAIEGLVQINDESSRRRTYTLTQEGLEAGKAALADIDDLAQDFIKRASGFVRTHSFSELVSAVYKAYPEMRENSVFQS